MNVTPKEAQMLKRMVEHDEYGEKGDMANHPWSWAVCETKSWAAVLGSLVKKGLMGQMDRGRDASCWLTEAGKQAYYDTFGRDGTWDSSK